MNQINLKAENIRVKPQEKGEGSGSLIFSILVLFLSVGLYGGIKYYHLDVNAKKSALEEQQKAKMHALTDPSYADVYYFTDQLATIDAQLQKRVKQSQLLVKLGGKVIPDFNGSSGTSFQSLTMDDQGGASAFKADIVVPDFNALSSQLKAFSMMDGVSDVNASDVSRTEGGLLKASVSFTLSPTVEKKSEMTTLGTTPVAEPATSEPPTSAP